MWVWDQAVEILRQSIFAYAQVCHGNLAGGILIVAALTRLALMPVGIRLARATRVHQRVMERIQPEIDRIRRAHGHDPRKLAEETQRLMQREGVSVVPPGALVTAAQTPVWLALYSAVRQAAALGGRFLWIANIARPDVLLMLVVAALTVMATRTSGTAPPPNPLLLLLSAAITCLVLSKMAAGVALYWGVSTAGSALQSFIVKQEPARA
jgi:YidC/Oxa1 family membrane protein insertase